MTIKIGDRIPDAQLTIASSDGPQPTTSGEYFGGRRVALFAVPGAFTPTCSARHLPSFVEKAGDLKAKGVDEIACVSVNDPFVMSAWNERDGSQNITMLAEGKAISPKARPDQEEQSAWASAAAILDGRQRRRGRAAERRGAGRISGIERGDDARTAVRR